MIFFVLALLRGLLYTALIPPWQSPDEHGHYEYAWLVSQHGPLVGKGAISPAFQQRVLESMVQFDYWRLSHQPTPEVLPVGFTDPADRWIVHSRPQVGDERPMYYWLVGGLLWLSGVEDVVVGMYVGRVVSVLLFALAVGLAALTTRSLFSHSLFMQVVPPAFMLFLPMLGEMGAAVSSDAIGVLAGTLFFASLIPVLRDGLTWRRVGGTVVALALALLAKKTTLFLIPTALLALPVYARARGQGISRQTGLALVATVALLAAVGVVLGLIPGGDAAGWMELQDGCGPTRVEGKALEGKASLRVGACEDETVAQTLPSEAMTEIAGRLVTLTGHVRSEAETAIGLVWVRDSESHSQMEVAAVGEWRPFSLTHAVDAGARWVSVRLAAESSAGVILFDDLALTTLAGETLLLNGSAEQKESLLFDLLSDVFSQVGAPRRLVEQALNPQSWGLEAYWEYARGALFCFHSFWGLFGSQALPLPSPWYWAIELFCVLALVGNLVFLLSKPRRGWQVGYLLVLMGGTILLILQTLLPMIGKRGTYWLPQGRYLFSGVFAIAVLMAWGVGRLLPRRWETPRTVVAVGLMAGWDLLSLGMLVVPYFWGSA